MTDSPEGTKVHQHQSIEGHHFTPFASLLLHFPMAVNKAIGGSSQIFYEYKPQRRTLEATIFYRRVKDGQRLLGERIDIEFDRTAYSFDTLVEMVKKEFDWADHWYNHRGNPCDDAECQAMSTKLLDNISTDQNV